MSKSKRVGVAVLAEVLLALLAGQVWPGCAGGEGAAVGYGAGGATNLPEGGALDGGTGDGSNFHRNPDAAPCGAFPACPAAPEMTLCTSLASPCPPLTYCGICADGPRGGVCVQMCVPQGASVGVPCTSNFACRADLGLVCEDGGCVEG